MKLKIAFNILFFFSIYTFGQNELTIITATGDSISTFEKGLKPDNRDVRFIDFKDTDQLLKLILHNNYSKLITGNTIGGLGNFASVSTVEETFSGAVNIVRPNGIWDISISGGDSEGITSLFKDDEVVTGISFGISYHHFFSENAKIDIRESKISDIIEAERGIKSKYKSEKLKALSFESILAKEIKAKEVELKALTKLIDSNKFDASKESELTAEELVIESEIDLLLGKKSFYQDKTKMSAALLKLKDKYNDPTNIDPFKYLVFKSDSLKLRAIPHTHKSIEVLKEKLNKIRIAKKENKVDDIKGAHYQEQKEILNNQIKTLTDKLNYERSVSDAMPNIIDNKEEKEIKANREKINEIIADELFVDWITFGVEAAYKEYSLFDATRSIDKQIYKENDLIPSFNFAFNHYSNGRQQNSRKIGARKVKFFSAGFKIKYDNNIATLKEKEVTTMDSITSNRSLVEKVDAYIGSFEDNKLGITMFGDYYRFLGTKENIGIHLKATLDIGSFEPITSLRTGFIFPFINKEDKTSFFNLELFFGLNDIFKNSEDESLFNRNVVGIQATLPFNFKIL